MFRAIGTINLNLLLLRKLKWNVENKLKKLLLIGKTFLFEIFFAHNLIGTRCVSGNLLIT